MLSVMNDDAGDDMMDDMDAGGTSTTSTSHARPPLAILIDFQQYVTRILHDLHTKHDVHTRDDDDNTTLSAYTPIRSVMSFLLETCVYILLEHVSFYMDTDMQPLLRPSPQQLALQHKQAQVAAQQAQQQQHMYGIYASDATQHMVTYNVAQQRLHKQIETYRDRLKTGTAHVQLK